MNRKAACLSCAAALVSTGPAVADIVDVRFTGTGLGHNVRTSYLGSTHNVFAGQLYHQFSDGTGEASLLDGPLITYCSELTEYVTNSTREYELTPLPLAPSSDPMGELSAQALTDVWDFAGGQQFATQNTGDNRDFAAAFQIAVWEIVHDYDGSLSSLDASSGNLTVTKTNGQALSGGIVNHLSGLFGAVGGNSSFGGLRVVTRAGAQDQVVVVPTPGTLALCLAAFVPLAGSRRRRVE